MPAPLLTLNDGRTIPQLGLGVYKVPDRETRALVSDALSAGYRHIDTAALYGNERGVGEGIRDSGLAREDVFVTTKVWNDRHGYDDALSAARESLEKLGTGYIDLLLIHWPQPRLGLYPETWRALERLRADGLVRSIGVSNFQPAHLDRLAETSEVVPVLNQVELHPWLTQQAVRAYGAEHGIATQAWGPLARAQLLEDPVLTAIAAAHGRSAAQVVIRWHLQHGIVVIPKSSRPERVRENAAVFDFALTVEEVAAIDGLDRGHRTGPDPDAWP